MIPYSIVLDVWEGSLDIDEIILWDAGVRGLVIRLNSILGGLHPDENFPRQWEQSERFARDPYYVYNPWVSGAQNFEWLGDHMPLGVKRIFADIEVKKDGYSPTEYAANVQGFVNRCIAIDWRVTLYTGLWFVPNLSAWPQNTDYWWARYPYAWYPDQQQFITWQQIHNKAQAVEWKPGCTLGECSLWQISGDRYKPPGCAGRVVDINLFNGDEMALYDYMGCERPEIVSWPWQVTRALRSLGYPISDPESV